RRRAQPQGSRRAATRGRRERTRAAEGPWPPPPCAARVLSARRPGPSARACPKRFRPSGPSLDLLGSTLGRVRIVRLASTPSTQDVARDLPVGTAVVADFQTAGRGRLRRVWEAPPGTALLASFVMPARPLASLAAGVAAAHACGPSARLKWPNDVLLHGAKLAGILAERLADRVVLGIGVNLTAAPPGP